MHLLATFTSVLAVFGMITVCCGVVAVRRFAGQAFAPPALRPAVTILTPLCGAEPALHTALASLCAQDYPELQIVFGVQNADDPALRVAYAMVERFPARDIRVVLNAELHGSNRKISNLINMLPAASHDLLVLADSDLHVGPDYLDRVIGALMAPGIGLVTTVCAGLPTGTGLAAKLGAEAISHVFLPGALLSRELGRQDCLGTTMALKRETLAELGGLQALVHHLADDNVLGQRVSELGLGTALASTVPLTSVPEPSLRALWRHEMRWSRTIRALEPVLFALSALQFPIFWAALTAALAGGAAWSLGLFAAAWLLRAAASRIIDHALRRRRADRAAPAWLLPVRDAMSVLQVAASFLGDRVTWRGQLMRADNGRAVLPLASYAVPVAIPAFVTPIRRI